MNLFMVFLNNISKIKGIPSEVKTFIENCNDTLSYTAPEAYGEKIRGFSSDFNVLMMRHKSWNSKFIKIYNDVYKNSGYDLITEH